MTRELTAFFILLSSLWKAGDLTCVYCGTQDVRGRRTIMLSAERKMNECDYAKMIYEKKGYMKKNISHNGAIAWYNLPKNATKQ